MFCFAKLYLIEVMSYFILFVFITGVLVFLFRKRFKSGGLVTFIRAMSFLALMTILYLVYQGYCSRREMEFLKNPFSGCSKVKIFDSFTNFDTERADTIEIEISDAETISKMAELLKPVELKRDGSGFIATISYVDITTYYNNGTTRKFSLFLNSIYMEKHWYSVQKNKNEPVLDVLRKQLFSDRRLMPRELEEYIKSEEENSNQGQE